MSAHTPGPWVPHHTNNTGQRANVWSANGDVLVAKCHSPSLSLEGNRANARLISAAPELLQIVETFDAYMGHAGEEAEQDSLNPVRALRWKAQQAIAKATGGQP